MKATEHNRGSGLKVLAIHRYFWPDSPPYASMLRAITAQWVKDGHQVEVLSSQPGYKPEAKIPRQPSVEQLDGVRVKRLSLPVERKRPLVRLLNVFRFCLSIIFHSWKRGKFDVIMVSTAPPVMLGAATRIAAKLTGAQLIYHCMDVHPEIGRLSGEFSNKTVFNILRAVDKKTCSYASAVVVLSDDMAESIQARPGAGEVKFEVINNFELPVFSQDGVDDSVDDETESLEILQRSHDNTFRILFAGNLGRFQGLENIIDGMTHIKQLSNGKNIELWLMGDGTAIDDLKERAASLLGKSVFFIPHGPVQTARAVMQQCDAGLISLTTDIYKYAFPSKTMTYLSEACPLVAVVEPQSALARLIETNNIGVVVTPDSPQDFADKVSELAQLDQKEEGMSEKAKAVAEELFTQQAAMRQWSDLLAKLAQRREKPHE